MPRRREPPAATPEEEAPPMVRLIAIARDGTSQRLRFATEAEAAAERLRATGHSLYWHAWSETLGRYVSIPED